jgi:DNA repair protein RadC
MKKISPNWEHPGGKLIEVGSDALTQEELVAILIGTGYKGKTALDIANDLMYQFYSFYGLLGKKAEDLSRIKGLKKGKINRIAAAYEIAKRIILEKKWDVRAVRKITLELPDLSDSELLAVLIETGYKEKTALDLANELFNKYLSWCGLGGQRLSDFAKIKGLGDVKVVRIAAAYEIAGRVIDILEKE